LLEFFLGFLHKKFSLTLEDTFIKNTKKFSYAIKDENCNHDEEHNSCVRFVAHLIFSEFWMLIGSKPLLNRYQQQYFSTYSGLLVPKGRI